MRRFRMITLALTLAAFATACGSALADHGGSSTVVVVQSGTIKVHNESSFPMELRLDGAHMGRIAAHQNLVLASTPVGQHRLVATYQGREEVPSRVFNLSVAPHQVAHVVIAQPAGRVLVHNPNHFGMQLFVTGAPRGTVPAHGSLMVGEIPAGRAQVAVRGPGGATINATIRVLPGGTARWEPALFTGAIQVRNNNYYTVRVFIDGRKVGKLHGHESRTYEGLTPGAHMVEVKGKHGVKVAHRMVVRPADVATWAVAAPTPYVASMPAGPAVVAVPMGGPHAHKHPYAKGPKGKKGKGPKGKKVKVYR